MKINPEDDTQEGLLVSYNETKDSQPEENSSLKWVGLLLVCLYPFGRFWAFDNPQALQDTLIPALDITSEQYNLFYTAYSAPNYILPFFSGFLVDKYGVKFGILCFGSLLVLGQFLFWLGCVFSSYGVALAGRFLFGIGGESSLLVKYIMLVKWFDNRSFGFASGATFLSQRLGSTFNSLFTPKIYQATQSIGWATFIGFLICLFCWFCGIVWLLLNRIYKKKNKVTPVDTNEPKAEKPQLKQIFKFQRFSFLFGSASIIYLAIFISFTANGNSFLQKQYGFSQTQAGNVLSPLYLVAGVFTLVFGKVVDIFGKKLHFIVMSFICEASSMFMFLILPQCSECYIGLFPLAFFGLSSALFSAAYWPAVNLLEKKEFAGMLVGLITVGYNIGEGVFPAIVGAIEDGTTKDNGYYYVLLFEGLSACFGLVLSIIIEILNNKQSRGLNDKVLKHN